MTVQAARRRASEHAFPVALKPLPWGTLIAAAVSLWLPFANYGLHGELMGGDAASAWAEPAETIRRFIGVFVDYPGLGINGAIGIQGIFPALSVAALLHAVGISTALAARLIIALYFFGAIVGAQRLGRELLRSEQPWIAQVAALSGGLLYGVNHYTLHVFGTVQTYFPLGYVALPWLLYGIVVGCERDRRAGIAIFAAAFLVAGGVATNLAFFGVVLLVVPLGAAMMLAGGIAAPRVLTVCGTSLLVGLALSAWWVLPVPTAIGAGLGQLSAEDPTTWVRWMSERSSYSLLFRLDGYVGTNLMPAAGWYASPFGSLMGYVPLIVGVVGIGVVRPRAAALALGFFCAFVFLAKGVHPPLGVIYQAMIDHVPGFSIFRSPYDKWAQLAALMLVVLYQLGLAGLLRRLGDGHAIRTVQAVVAACAVLPVVIYPWPAYAGRIVELDPSDPITTYTSFMPRDYRTVGTFLRTHAAGWRTVIFNEGALPYPLYTWGYFGEDPLPALAGVPVSGTDTISRASVMPVPALRAALDEISVRFIVVHYDVRNPAPSPDVGLLVAAGDARSVLQTRSLGVYERVRRLRPFLSIVRNPALVSTAASDEAPLDPWQTARLVPDATAQLVPPAGATLVAPQARAPQAGDRWVGVALPANVPPRGAGAASTGVVLANPLSVTVTPAHCATGGPALRVRPATEWWYGGVSLGSYDATLCLLARSVSVPLLDGKILDAKTGIVTITNHRRHTLDVIEAKRETTLAARRLPDRELIFAFVAPFQADAVEVRLPVGVAGPQVVASVVGSDASILGRGFDAGGAPTFLVPLVARAALRGELCFVDFTVTDHALWPKIARMQTASVTAIVTMKRRLTFTLPDAALTGRTLSLRPRAALLERINVPPAARPPSTVAWSPSPGAPAAAMKAWGSRLVLLGAEGSMAQSGGTLFVTDRYRLRVRYRASGDAALALLLDGYVAARRLPLIADGRERLLDAAVHPPTNSSGGYVLQASAARGTLHVLDARFAVEGPNALFYALRPARLGGRVLYHSRPAPWRFDASVADCAPCALSVAVSDPREWWLRGARVLGTYAGPGQSTGMAWSPYTTGTATWLLDAGRAPRRIQLLYVPALLAGFGLIVSLATLVVGCLWYVRAPAGVFPAVTPPSATGRTLDAPRVVLAALAALLATGSFPAAVQDGAGLVLWGLLLVLAAVLLVSPRPGPAAPEARPAA